MPFTDPEKPFFCELLLFAKVSFHGTQFQIHILKQVIQRGSNDLDAADAVALYIDGQQRIMRDIQKQEPAIAMRLIQRDAVPS